MELLLQRVVDGVADGVIYGALALALVLIYRATGLVNFAQGEMAMFSTFVVWAMIGPTLGLPLVVACLLGLAFGFVLGVAIERGVMRAFRDRDHLSQAIVTMGFYLGLNALAAYVFTTQPQAFPSLFSDGAVRLGGVTLTWNSIGMIGTLAVTTLALRLFLMNTPVGLAMRATTSNPTSASLSGINVDMTLSIGWGLAGALGALAGILLAPSLFVSPNMMQATLLYAFAAAIVGGLDSAPGAVVGGLVVGITQHLMGGYLVGAELQLASALLLILVVLLIRPQGLFGHVKTERV